ncbi:MAG: glyoxylate/hydroxypyruvate reductase A [Hyphomicrobiaceae bacterium]
MSLLLEINGSGDNWGVAPWRDRFASRLPQHPVLLPDEAHAAPERVRYAAVWKPRPGLLAAMPKLEVIFNLGAGVDALLKDGTLPNVPLVRVVNTDLTKRMTEYVVMHVLMYHRQQRRFVAQQAERIWDAPEQAAAGELRVGLLGLGELGRDSADVLQRIGFQVAGWSRSAKTLPGVTCFSGADGLAPFLARTDILVALVPLTPDTHGILDMRLFKGLARDGVLGRPVIVNAGRGGLQVESDILAALDDGTLGGATLDVFETEPLPADSPLWGHPLVTVTPHNAADSSPSAIADDVAAQILAYEAGKALRNVVDRAKGY